MRIALFRILIDNKKKYLSMKLLQFFCKFLQTRRPDQMGNLSAKQQSNSMRYYSLSFLCINFMSPTLKRAQFLKMHRSTMVCFGMQTYGTLPMTLLVGHSRIKSTSYLTIQTMVTLLSFRSGCKSQKK